MLLSEAFSRSARRYDVLTQLNPGYRRELRRATRKMAALLNDDVEQPVVWDLGCGTGLSTQAVLDAMPAARVVGIDASAGMLDAARSKPWPAAVSFVRDRVENLPQNTAWELAAAPDGVFAAYLLRNVPPNQRTTVLAQIRAAMKPGAPLVLHDYSVAESWRAQTTWTLVCFAIIIPMSALCGAKPGLFTYLWRSVMHNDTTQTVLRRLARAGFQRAAVFTARGWHRNILHTYIAVNQGQP